MCLSNGRYFQVNTFIIDSGSGSTGDDNEDEMQAGNVSVSSSLDNLLSEVVASTDIDAVAAMLSLGNRPAAMPTSTGVTDVNAACDDQSVSADDTGAPTNNC